MAEDEQLKARLAEAEAELQALRERLGSALIEKDQLQRQAERPGGISSIALDRVEARLRDMEYRFDEHLTRLVDEGRARDTEIRAMVDEVAVLRRSRDDAVGSLKVLEHACKVLALRLHKIETGGRLKVPTVQAGTGHAVAARLGATAPRTEPQQEAKPRVSAATIARSAMRAPGAEAAIHVTAASVSVSDIVGLVHFEDRPELRETVQSVAAKWSIGYHVFGEPIPDEPGERMLLVNLLGTAGNALDAVLGDDAWRTKPARGFTYWADGARGAEIGLTDFVPPPFDEVPCSEYLLGRAKVPQRLLVVSEKFEVMTPLRERLAMHGCAMSMAFDGRQALDLAPMIKPDLVLVDLNLPKGEALRLLARLRSNVITSRLPFTLVWGQAIDGDELRDQARRSVRDVAFTSDELLRGISRVLTPKRQGVQATA